MRIAIISDIHDNFHNLSLAIKIIKNNSAELIICLGDLTSNGVARELSSCGILVKCIWGNNDGEKFAITKTSLSEGSKLIMSRTTYDFLKIDDRDIFITHFPYLVKHMAKSGDFDAIFFGHTHIKSEDNINNCLIVNPGEIAAYRDRVASFALYDTKNNNVEFIEIPNSISTKAI